MSVAERAQARGKVIPDGDVPRRAEGSVSATVPSRTILGTRVDATSYDEAAEIIATWARNAESRYVSVATVHGIIEAHDHEDFRCIMNGSDLVTSDGMPLVWGLKLLGIPTATRVYGPYLTPRICAVAERKGIPVGFYGGSPESLAGMIANLRVHFPHLAIVYQYSPPFRSLMEAESAHEIAEIANSGARILFVGLGCPKQERWMAARQGRIPATMVGVGAAFDFLAGTKRQAPAFMQRTGLEWFFRLVTEPRRLWRRYLSTNPRFIGLFAAQLLAHRRGQL